MQVFQGRNICLVLITTLCLAGFSVEVYAQNGPETAIVHVNIDREWPSNDPEDGESWETAYRFLQDALDRAVVLLNPPFDFENVEIWVAQGTYRPDQRAAICATQDEDCPNCGNCDREATFNLRNNVEIYGGFNGTETLREQRDWELNITILSGDLDGDDDVLIYNQAGELVLDFDENSYSENSYHVVTAPRGINETATIDGFTIRTTIGSAFIAIDARPRVLGCTFISATSAAVHLRGECFIVFDRCQFQSPMREPIRADESATVHCAGE